MTTNLINRKPSERLIPDWMQTREDYNRFLRESFKGQKVNLEVIKKLSPDHINNEAFWQDAIDRFGTLPVCGANHVNDVEQANKLNREMHLNNGKLVFLERMLLDARQKKETRKILEIGPGFGSLFYYLNENYPQEAQVYGVDVNPLIDDPRVVKGDGQSIPESLGGDFDFVFSFNVFQHLSNTQRRGYYKDVAAKLKTNGTFMVENWAIAPKEFCFDYKGGYNGEDGKTYLTHFGQFTEIQDYQEIIKDVRDCGFHLHHVNWLAPSYVTLVLGKTPSIYYYGKS